MGKVFKARSVFHSLACVALVACAGPSATDEGRAPPSGQDDDAIGETQGAIELAPLYPVADTTVRLASPFSSYGNTTTLGVTSASIVNLQKSLIRFDQAAIAAAVGTQALYSARLDLTVAGISVGWLGGRIEALPMNRAWPEGNGLLGRGPSWVCADDTNTTLLGNLVNNCSAANAWGMVPTDPRPLPFTTPATDRAPVFTGGASTISLDVTKDVVRFLNGAPNNGWILAGSGGVANGEWVNFGSRESTNRPRLILNVGADQCTGDPLKGVPGQCGCGVPDSDTNFDGVADCVDAVVNATADTTIRLAVPFGNDGTGTLLGVTSTSIASLERSLVRVDQAAIDAVRAGRRVDGAFLEVTVAGISVAFGSGLIDIHAMNRGWPEGNGLLGHGPSWVCADDTNTTLSGNLANNCATSDLWAMLPLAPGGVPYVAAPTASAQLTWPGTRSLRFDVTADVQRFVRNGDPNFGWLIKGRESLLSGQWVNFGSRESGAPPALLLELGPYCPDTGKPEPGQCGCGTPDTDSDGDTTADCVDRCPDDNLKTAPGLCGCGTPDTDSDGDKIPDCKDPCPADASTTVGGDCGCPSGGALPAGTACNGVCGSGVCNGAGVCGTPTSCVPAPSCGCVPYFTRDRIYWVCTCAKPGSDAASACGNTDEQTLVRIDDAAENAWVQARIGGDAWIGATDLPDEGTWHWPASGGGSEAVFWDGAASGAPHYGRYSNWADTEPSGGAGSNCAAILKSTGRWVDDSCGASRPFACERIHFKDTPIEPDPRPACERLNIPCGTGDWSQCQSEATVFEESTPAAQKASLSNCDLCTKNCTDEAQCAIDCDSACTGSAEPPTGNASCPDLDDPAEYALPAGANIYCAIQIPLGVECASSSTCGGFHCGRATRCSSCDPAG
ncbi:MAG: C-type lectin domain-containing protein, partial [Deltaproteobacteria bacterium]|nr:C-type lectin domain-containing protein [Deltaproteobacteria bacterium]